MRSTRTYRSRPHSKLSLVAAIILLVVSISGVVLWRLQSVQLLSVESSSMAPNIRRGDAVVLRSTSMKDLAVGDVVSYRSPVDQSVLITHRIVAVEKSWGLIVTKGDNVSRNDRPIAASEIIGKVHARVNYLGYGLNFLRSPAGLVAGVYIPATIIIGLEFKRLVRQYGKPTYRLLSYVKTR